MPKPLAERIADAERRADQARERVSKLKQRAQAEDRKQRTRRMIVLGAIVDAHLDSLGLQIMELLTRETHRNADREAISAIASRCVERVPTQSDGTPWPNLKFEERESTGS